MNLAHAQALRMTPGPAGTFPSTVHYEGSDALRPGHLLCANSDYGTASAVQADRWNRAEKPATGKLNNFLGAVGHGRTTWPSEPGLRPINLPGSICQIWTDQNCVIDSTILTVKADSYVAGGIGHGMPIARALQTVDRSSVAGLVLAKMFGTDRSRDMSRMGTPTGTNNVLSSGIWESCPWKEIGEDPGLGFRFFDDFTVPMILADAVAQAGYYTKQDTDVTIQAHEGNDELGGIMEIANNDGDVDFGHLFLSDGVTMNLAYIAAATFKPFWFEARLKVAVVTTEIGIFCGLCEIGNVDDAGMVINTAEMKDENFIGFQSLCADPNALLPVFKADAQTKANGTSVALVADTYINVGLYGNGTIITSFVNNVSKHAITAALIAGATFPSVTPMSLALMTQTGEASESAVSLDWWRFAQLR